MDIGKSFDRYVMQARVVPVLLVVFPLASLVVIWLPEESVGSRLLGGLISLVLLSLVAQVGRDGGKRQQEALFRKWNGMPSIRILRYRDSKLPWITMERLRSSLAKAVGIPCPTKAEEEADPVMADEVYAGRSRAEIPDRTRGRFCVRGSTSSAVGRRRGRLPRPAFLPLEAALFCRHRPEDEEVHACRCRADELLPVGGR